MVWDTGMFGQIITIIILAIALGMDAFSLGLGIGLKGIRLLHILRISCAVAFFHTLMPFAGMVMGQYASALLGEVTLLVGGALLLLLGIHMVYSSLQGDEMRAVPYYTFTGLLLFSTSVSIDSFSVGVSLGMFTSDIILIALVFGFFGGAMAILGLLLGRKVSHWLGEYGELLGGIILVTFGIKFILESIS